MTAMRPVILTGIAGALAVAAWMCRYEIEPAAKSVEFVYRLDRWTGQAELVDMGEELDQLDARRAQRKRQ